MELNFTTEEANEYAGFFATNEIDLSMIPEITDPILRTIGIDKAGQWVYLYNYISDKKNICFSRIRILRLKQKPPVVQTPRRSPIASPRPVAVRKMIYSNFDVLHLLTIFRPQGVINIQM